MQKRPIYRVPHWARSLTRRFVSRLGCESHRTDSHFVSDPYAGERTFTGPVFSGNKNGLLRDDVALITGAARGIGAAIARALAREGAKTFLTDIAEEGIRTLALQINETTSSSAFLAADLRVRTNYDHIVDAALDRFGSVSIMVHAASPSPIAPVFDLDDFTGDENLMVNLEAGYQIAKRVSRAMVRANVKGRLLFITSLHARTPYGNPAYSAAKASVTLVMREFSKKLGPHGIRVNAIAPGIIVRDESRNAHPSIQSIPLRRAGRPDDIANVAVALLADQYSSYVTGTTITVDGGLSLANWQDF